MKLWPFLISANPYHENGLVVVPDFIKESKAERELIRCSQGFETGLNEAIYLRGHHPGTGPIDMLFRVVQATGRQFGLDHDEVLNDRRHRPVQIIEGFVVRDRPPNQPFTAEQLQAAHALIEPHFQSYWQQEEHWMPVSSRAFELSAEKGDILDLLQRETPSVANFTKRALDAPKIGKYTERLVNSTNKRGLLFGAGAAIAMGGIYLGYRQFIGKENNDKHGEIRSR